VFRVQRMKAARLNADCTITVRDVPIPEPAPGQARLRVLQAGICNTDVELTRGFKGFEGTMGHEFVAVIDKICPPTSGAAPTCVQSSFFLWWNVQFSPLVDSSLLCLTLFSIAVQEGDRVVSEINFVPDGTGCRCYHERAQHPERAAIGIFKADGCFAEFVVVPLINLHLVPPSLSDDEAMFTEPLAAACQILQQFHFKHDDSVAVVGTGKLGIMIAQAIASTHTEVLVLGRRTDAFPLFQERGLKTALVGDVLAEGRKFSLVVDCTGSAEGFDSALNLTRASGTMVMKSTFAGNTSANLTKVVVDEITLIGSRCGPFSLSLKLLESKRVSVQGLITHRFSLDQAPEAVAKAAAPDSFKVAIRIAP